MGEKVQFDEINKIINITQAPDVDDEIYIDVKSDLYSDGKEDWVGNENLRKFVFPITAVGGNPLPGEKALGSTFFLASDWKIKPYNASHRLTINGNLYAEDGSDLYLDTDGAYTVRIMQQVSSLVDSTIQQLAEIEYASFNGGVTVDISSSYSGTDYPIGTEQQPVNNLPDALLIAAERGFSKIYLNSNLVIDDGSNINNFCICGRDQNITLTIDANVSASGILLNHVTLLNSVLDGTVDVHDCNFVNVSNFNGYLQNCGLAGNITFGGTTPVTTLMSNCYSMDMDNYPVIDLNASGHNLSIKNYSGVVTIKNLNDATAEFGVGMDTGMVIIDSTVVAGTGYIAGLGLLQDNSGPSAVIATDTMINKSIIGDAVWENQSSIDLCAGMKRALGLLQENFVMDQQIYIDYNGAKLLTSGRIRTFSDTGLTQLLATYQVTASWNNGQCTSYQVVQI